MSDPNNMEHNAPLGGEGRVMGDGATVPWRRDELRCWNIVGMNHYHIGGQQRLYVSMTRFRRCITAEGPDGPEIWDDLAQQALDAFP